MFSVICSGRRLDRLAVSGGQFFQWRFLTKELWWHAHPYSLSALPRPPYIRVTVKGLGDQSRAVGALKPGHPRRHRRSLRRLHPSRPRLRPGGADRRRSRHHAAAGPPRGPAPRRSTSRVIVRASTAEDIVHRDEIAALVDHAGGQFHEVIGSRHEVPLRCPSCCDGWSRTSPSATSTSAGPDGFSDGIVAAARRLGVPIATGSTTKRSRSRVSEKHKPHVHADESAT